jgi:hypothetical protein
MRFDSVMAAINNIRPSQSLTYAPSFGIPDLRNGGKRRCLKESVPGG